MLSHAEALADYRRDKEVEAELARAANCEEQVASWLDAAGREQEAGVSATSCYERLGEYSRAVTLLRAALSTPLATDYRQKIQKHLDRCLSQVEESLRKAS